MTKLQNKLEELKSFLIEDGYNDSNIVYQTLVDVQKLAINHTRYLEQLKENTIRKIPNISKKNRLNLNDELK